VAALALGAALVGVARGADSLNFGNPFAQQAGASGPGAAQGTPDAPLELRGIMVVGTETMFSIYDPSRHSATWTKLNEAGRDYIVRNYDPGKDSVVLDYQGRTLNLVLHTAKVASAPVNMPQPVGVTPSMPPQPVGGPVVLNPSPADEQRRLEAIAAEVNRRRMIRQQALQASRDATQQQGQTPPPPPPPGQPR
jgi:hypothetical protein